MVVLLTELDDFQIERGAGDKGGSGVEASAGGVDVEDRACAYQQLRVNAPQFRDHVQRARDGSW